MHQKNNNKRTLFHLGLIPNIGSMTVFKILRHLFHTQFPDLLHVGWMEILEHAHLLDFETLYTYTSYDFINSCGLSERSTEHLIDGLADTKLVDLELELAQRHHITITTLLDVNYPEILKQIHAPPLILYCQGAPLTAVAKRMAFVGSRKATSYARDVTNRLVPSLVDQGWEIVSGGAEGADTMAHEMTLNSNGITRVVLGSGLLCPYPLSNIALFEQIAKTNGTIISPFSLNTAPERSNFPARNRIIAGLSLGCVVVQAAIKSGALITAQYALEQGRQVFAIPGLMYDELSAGCHALIKQGAKLVHSVNDILEEFGESCIQKMQFIPSQLTLETVQDPVLKHLSEPATVDDLLAITGLEMGALQERLFALNLEGKIRQNFVGTWESVGNRL